MWTTRLFRWILILIATTCHLCRGNVNTDTWNSGDDVIQLSMMENSAAYVYTQSEESDSLATEYIEKECKLNKALDKAWKRARDLRRTHPRLSKVPVPPGLKEQHVVAIIAYTVDNQYDNLLNSLSYTLERPLYSQFNAALRLCGANDSVYAERFPFKSFQYLLSVAIDRLREDLPQTTYRGMEKMSNGAEGDRIKFGYFASTSHGKAHEGFGTKTIFTIYSRYGAQIQNYSFYSTEDEVLIPPYEAFKITRYNLRADGVDISLHMDGKAGIPVRVERGSNGEMIVLRCEGTSIFTLAWLCIPALLAHFLL